MHNSYSTFILFSFQESLLWALSSAFRLFSFSNCLILFTHQHPYIFMYAHTGAGHSLLVLSKSSDPVFVQAQLEKQHRQKGRRYFWIVSKSMGAYFLCDLVVVLKEQVSTRSFRSSASLINIIILLLIKLFEEDKPCASTFALTDLTCMLPGLQRHRES